MVVADTATVTVQLPFAGTIAPARVTVFDEAVRDSAAPVQFVAGAGELAIVNALGSVSLRPVWVSANPFALVNVIVSVEAMVCPTVAGANVWDTVGATGVAATAVGQAWVPAVDGAELLALFDVTDTLAVSVSPAESVTVSMTLPVPVPLPGRIVAFAVAAPETTLAPPLAVHE